MNVRIPLLAATLLTVALSCLSFADSQIKEDWKDQKAGDISKELVRWNKEGKGADTDVAIMETDGKRFLEVHQRLAEKYCNLGIRSKELVEWKNELRISFDGAFMPEGENGSNLWTSLVVRLANGDKTYQVNIQPSALMFSRQDPTNINPNPGAVNPIFTPLYRTKAGERQYSAPEMKHYELVFTRTSSDVKIDLFVNNESTPAGSYVDTTPTNLGDAVRLSLTIENLGWMKIGDVTISSK